MTIDELDALAGKWILEAQKHEDIVREIEGYSDPDERKDLEPVARQHQELAAVLYQCAQDLLHRDLPKASEEDIQF